MLRIYRRRGGDGVDHPPRQQVAGYRSRLPLARLSGQGSPRRRPLFVPEEGNGRAERFIRTVKEKLLWLKTFQTIKESQQALSEFKDFYNRIRLVERRGQRSLSQFKRRAMDEIPAAA